MRLLGFPILIRTAPQSAAHIEQHYAITVINHVDPQARPKFGKMAILSRFAQE